MQGGNVSNNPIYTGALGEYNGVVLHASARLPNFTTSSQAAAVIRSVLCGAQATGMAFGRGHSPERYDWVEDYFDYENQFGVAAGCISGLKKLVFNGNDFATISVSTWAASHSSN